MPAPARRTYPGRVRAAFGMLIISFGAMMGPLDSAVNIAFPSITTAFGLRISDIQWIVIVYVLAQSCLSIVFGKLGDLHGHRRVFMVGAALATIIHAVAGFAPNYPSLVALRALQGIAVGIAMSCGPALATFLYPPERKRAALSFYTMLFAVGLAIGPILGGILIERFGWPSVFWYRAPIAFAALSLAILLPADLPHSGKRPALDIAGALWLAVMLGSFVAMLSLIRHVASAPHWPLLAACAWLVSTWLFIRQEKRAEDPVLRVEFYADPAFATIQLATLAINFFNFSIMLLAPYLLIAKGSGDLLAAGAMLSVYSAGQIVAGIVGSRLSKGIASAMLVRAGFAIAGAGVLATGFVTPYAPLWPLALALFAAGFGLGIFQVGNLDLTTTILPVSARGVAGSLVNVARLLGIIIGAAVITLLFDWLEQTDRLAQFRNTFMLLGVVQIALAAALSLRSIGRE